MALKLCERALVKDFLGIALADTRYDERINNIIEQVSAEVENITRRKFTLGTYTEYYQSYDQVFTDPTPQYVWVDAFPIVTTDPNPKVVTAEVPTGAIDGVNKDYQLAFSPFPASTLVVKVNNVVVVRDVHFVHTSGTKLITFLTPLALNDLLFVDYQVANSLIQLPEIIWAPNEFHDTIGVKLESTDYQMEQARGCLIIRRASGLASGALLPLYLGEMIFVYAPRGFKVTYTGGYQVSQPPTEYTPDPMDDFGVVQVPQGLKYIVAKKVAQDLQDRRRVLGPWTIEQQKTLRPYQKKDIAI